MELGAVNLDCMALLDRANRQAFGIPAPAQVSLTVEQGPFIVISGHDLHDLKLLLEQTQGRGINIYTPRGNASRPRLPGAQKIQPSERQFRNRMAESAEGIFGPSRPCAFTTNCLMPPKPSYSDRVFTTALVSYPGIVHIDGRKDFSPVIQKALELGGFKEDVTIPGINGGTKVTTGFGREAVLAAAGTVAQAVRQNKLRHIFLVGGCDGARPGRNYYTDFVKQAPEDTLILTLACGKYRFNDLELGTLAGIPRLLDMGQCNDAFGAIQVAAALAEAFGCQVNDLPYPGSVLVRTESCLYPFKPAASGYQEHLPWPHPSRLSLSGHTGISDKTV